MGQIIADIEKNSREIIRVEVSEFKGRELINLRLWYQHFDGEYKPTQKGVTIDVSHYKELKNAVDKIGDFLADKNRGTIPEINVQVDDEFIDEDGEEEETEEEDKK